MRAISLELCQPYSNIINVHFRDLIESEFENFQSSILSICLDGESGIFCITHIDYVLFSKISYRGDVTKGLSLQPPRRVFSSVKRLNQTRWQRKGYRKG